MKKLLFVSLFAICIVIGGFSIFNQSVEAQSEQSVEAAANTSPIVRIVSPLNSSSVAPGEGRTGAGSLNGTGFVLNLEVVTRDNVPVAVRKATVSPAAPGIRHVDQLGNPNPDFPGLTVFFDADLITPDGVVIPKNTNLGSLFNVAGVDDTPGPGVTVWAGWHVLESLAPNANTLTITAMVRDEAGRVGQDQITVNVKRDGAISGQALTPAPIANVGGDGIDDADGPVVSMIAPRVPTSVAANPNLMFIQVKATDRSKAGIGVNETGIGITSPPQAAGLIFDPTQIPNPAIDPPGNPNRNYPGLVVTFDADLIQPNGNRVKAGTNLTPLFDIAGSETDKDGFVCTTADWVVGGSLERNGVKLVAGDVMTIISRVTDNKGRTGSDRITVNISSVANGQSLTAAPASLQFGAATFTASEGSGSAQITVTRTGSSAGIVTIDYATANGTASDRSDYIAARGTLRFAAGETSKTFTVFIVDDALAESDETVNLTLSNPSGASLGAQRTAVLTIKDNDTATSTTNPLDAVDFFVRQQYLDFLNREPDAGGFAFWTSELRRRLSPCNSIASTDDRRRCILRAQASVSAAFFLSTEFQQTGYLVYRTFDVAFARSGQPRPAPGQPVTQIALRLEEFLPDAQNIARDVVVGQTGAEELLAANKQAFFLDFVQRAAFNAKYPATLTAEQYVDALYASAGVTPTAPQRQAAIIAFNDGGTDGRARVLEQVAENEQVFQREFNRAFVLMQYFGYLRRNPDATPDTNLNGYNFWLRKLDSFSDPNANVRDQSVALSRVQRAEMIEAFIASAEYRQRFGTVDVVIQAPALPGAQAISSRDRIYTADQVSNTVSVIDPSTNMLLGTIALGKPRPDDILAPNYREQIDVHGLGFSPDGSLLAVISVTTNAVTIIQTATNKILGNVYVGRAPHEGFFTPDGKELWVAIRGENYVSVIDVATMKEVDRIVTSDGASKVLFRSDGQVAFVEATRTPELDVIDVKSHQVIKRITGLSDTFTSDFAISPDGREAWLPHKKVGKLTIVDTQNFTVLGVINTGSDVNHPNFVTKPDGNFAYLTVGGENVVKVYRRNGGSPQLIATIPTGAGPHGIWPSPDNTRIYVALEDGDAAHIIDTTSNTIIKTIRIGQMPQALVYVANAVPTGDGRQGLTMQSVGLRIEASKVMVTGGGEAKIVLRELIDVDSVEVAAQGLAADAKYNVFAVKADGARQLISDFKADGDGKGMVTPLLKFFNAGFARVEVIRVS